VKYWSYWDDNAAAKTWPHIRICLDSMRRVLGDDLTIVTPETIDDLIGSDLIPDWRSVPTLGPRVCAIRAALLYLHGGCWIDADTVMFRRPVIDEDADLCYCVWPTPPRRVLSGYLAARKESPVIRAWIANINRTIAAGPRKDWWLVLGEHALTPAVDMAESFPYTRLVEWPLKMWIPLNMDTEPQYYCEPCDYLRWCENETVAFALNHSWLTANHKWGMVMDLAAMQQSPLLIHQLLSDAAAENMRAVQ
jgi:hypothetical protein